MTIEIMTGLSQALMMAALLFALLSVVLFFALDIRWAWTVLYGKSVGMQRSPRMPQRTRGIGKAPATERIAVRMQEDVCTEVIEPDSADEPASYGTKPFSLIQNITYTEYSDEETL